MTRGSDTAYICGTSESCFAENRRFIPSNYSVMRRGSTFFSLKYVKAKKIARDTKNSEEAALWRPRLIHSPAPPLPSARPLPSAHSVISQKEQSTTSTFSDSGVAGLPPTKITVWENQTFC